MDFSKLSAPAKELTGDVKEYLSLKEDQLKLQTTKVASVSIARLLTAILILNVCLIVLALLAFTAILGLGALIGNYAAGAGIVTGVFIVGLVVLILCRKKLFVNQFVRMFINLFYDVQE